MNKNHIERYLKEEITSDYDKGFSIDTIAKRYKISQEIDFQNKISFKKAYEKVCSIIYDFIMERGCIVKGDNQ